MRPADRSLLLTAAAALLAGACLVAGGLPAPVTATAGVLLALVLPGYALLRALFPGLGLDTPERILLVLGLNLATGILCGFLLNFLPAGLSSASWGASLGMLTIGCCAVAWWRGRGHADDPATVVPTAGPLEMAAPASSSAATVRTASASIPVAQLTMLAAAGVVALLALVVARAGVVAQPQPGYTALWVNPDESGLLVRVGVTDAEGHAQTYRLEVALNGVVVARQDDLSVSNGSTSVTSVQLPPAGAVLREVTAQLWRVDDAADAAPYRSVRTSVRGHAGGVAPTVAPAVGPTVAPVAPATTAAP